MPREPRDSGIADLVKAFRGGRIFLLLMFLSLVLFVVGRWALNFYVEILWFDSVHFLDVFWTRTFWQWGVRISAAVVTAAIVYANFAQVAETFGGVQIRRRYGNLEIAEQVPRRYIRLGLTAISLLLGFWFAAAIGPDAGTRALLFFRAPEWGASDPVFGHDLSFYAFTLPIISAILSFALVLAFFLFALSAAGYGGTGSVRWVRNQLQIDHAPRVHLSVLGGAILLLLAGRFWITRYLLLFDGNSSVQGIFGYADATARLPAYAILAAASVLAAIVVIRAGFRHRTAPMVAALATLAIAVVLVGEVFPSVVQRFRVQPNELAAESTFIEYNMDFTRRGFALEGIERSRFPYREPRPEDWQGAADQFGGLSIWTRNTLYTTFRNLEARFRYYDFPEVAIDRYETPEGVVPVAIAVREVDPRGIEDPNWQNRHIRERYITGVGAVASTASRLTRDGRPPMFLRGIPPEYVEQPGAPEIDLLHTSVFFGSRPQLWAVVNPGDDAFLDPTGQPGTPGVDFPSGILLDSPLRTLAFASRFGDANLLFASEVTSSSRFVFRRHVDARLTEIAPFLTVSGNPYPVIEEGRIYWMVDAFTATSYFPLAASQQVANRQIRYIRNSVKITIDGVTGETLLYRADDPSSPDVLLEAYSRAFPTLFRSLDEMPESLRAHLRYPRELLDLQANVLVQYHQETAPVFHGQQDVWSLATELSQGMRAVPYRPEYGLYRLPGEEEPDFLLSTVFVPAGRLNLAGLLVARWNRDRFGEILLYDIPVEQQVPGPRQVEALVEQDPIISQQFALWRQSGSEVWTGHLNIIPVGETLLYMEPIYLAAQEDAIPELRRFVVSDGFRVVMEPTLTAAIQGFLGEEVPIVADLLDAPDVPALRVRTPEMEVWPQEALDLLEQAERRLRAGDWPGFGSSLNELRQLLERLSRTPTGD